MRISGAYHQAQREYLIPCRDGYFAEKSCAWHGGRDKDTDPVMQLPPKKSEAYNAAQVYMIPVKQVHEDRANFQNRENAYSSDSKNRIINAVKNGTFRWSVFDPVILWKSPAGQLVILSGHSRTAAFRELSKQGAKSEGRGFDQIPAKIFTGSLEEAKKIALTSNVLATRETDQERALYYRKLRESGVPWKQLEAEAKENEGRNANTILAYSFLDKDGKVWNALGMLADADPTSRKIIETVAYWVGVARRQYSQLTRQHENEIYDWLKNGVYGNKPGQISNLSTFLEKINNAILRKSTFGVFDSNSPLNLLSLSTTTSVDQDLARLKAEIDQAKKDLDNKRKELIARGADNASLERVLGPYNDAVIYLQKKYYELYANKDALKAEEMQQASLFGFRRKKTPLNIFH